MHKISAEDNFHVQNAGNPDTGNNQIADPFFEIERGVHAALDTYSNIHRGSGHNSIVSTYLYEQARDIVMEYLGLNKSKYLVIFCTPRREAALKVRLKPGSYKSVSSQDINLSLGVRALAVKKNALPGGTPFQSGGGTTRLVARDWVIWAKSPARFEAGTPAIVNVITFARALQLIRHFGNNIFRENTTKKLTAADILYHDDLDQYSGRNLLDKLRLTLIGRSVYVPTAEGSRPFINLDNGASTPTFTPVWNAVCQTWRQSVKVKQDIINEVRSVCAKVLGAPATEYDVIFTSNTTEAINLAAESLVLEFGPETDSVVLNTLLEHNSNDLPWRKYKEISLKRLQIDHEGFIDLNELETFLIDYNQKGMHGKKRIRIVAVSGASNVLGVFNELTEISRIVHQYGARLLVDAAQLVAHRKVDIESSGIDYLAFSAHKVYAPFGTGVLVARKGLLHFTPAEMDMIRLSGEENTVGIASLGKSLLLLQRIGLDIIQQEEQSLTGRALNGLSKIEGLSIFGIKDPGAQNFPQKGGVIVFSLKNKFSNVVARELAEQGGIGVRYGCHCAHILIKQLVGVGPLLERFQGIIVTLFPETKLPGLTRVSLGMQNNEEDIDNLIYFLGKIARSPRTLPQGKIKQQMNDFVMAAVQKVYIQP
jgi:selenocysteine lyase/cysteine desulfurase